MLSYEEARKHKSLSPEYFKYMRQHGFSNSKANLLSGVCEKTFNVMANPSYSYETMEKLHHLLVMRVMKDSERMVEATLIILEN